MRLSQNCTAYFEEAPSRIQNERQFALHSDLEMAVEKGATLAAKNLDLAVEKRAT